LTFIFVISGNTEHAALTWILWIQCRSL
jgi:hypothetical protein